MTRFVVKDSYFKKAKKDGYRARSAYKIEEIQTKYHILRKGDAVLDLGCAPGSFLQVLSRIVGPEGRVIGIDILPVEPLNTTNIMTIQGDILTVNVGEILSKQGLTTVDAITSDIAPNLSGIRDVDMARVDEIYGAIRTVIEKSLKAGGQSVIKSFFSDRFKGTVTDLKSIFRDVQVFKPAASRSVSSEIFIVCRGKIKGVESGTE